MGRVVWKGSAMLAPLPAALVTCGTGEESNVLTVGWTGILCTHPPRTYIAVRPSRHSYKLLCETREFVLHIPSAKYAKEVDLCGIYTGAKVDKFARCGWERLPSAEVCAPTIAQCPIALECRVTEIKHEGTHDVFFADIVAVSVEESLLDENGKMHAERGDLLAYAHGTYYRLGEALGSIGFSTQKSTAPKAKRKKPLPRRTKQEGDRKK